MDWLPPVGRRRGAFEARGRREAVCGAATVGRGGTGAKPAALARHDALGTRATDPILERLVLRIHGSRPVGGTIFAGVGSA